VLSLAVPDNDDERALYGGDAPVVLLSLGRGVVALDDGHEVLVGRGVPATTATPSKWDLEPRYAQGESEKDVQKHERRKVEYDVGI
jgi:hypothetical protein